jgi:hypothetical protein
MSDDEKRTGGMANFRVGFGEANAVPEEPTNGTFRVVVIGSFGPEAEFATSGPTPAESLAITAAAFDEVMARFDLSLTIEVPDPLEPRGKPLRVPLRFPRLRAFHPDTLVREVEALRTLRAEAGPATVKTSAPPGPSGGSLIDDILAGMATSSPAATGAQRTTEGSTKGALLASILAHPEVRRLERVWRGLKFLVDRGASRGVTVEIVAARADAVETALERRAREPVDLFVVDHEVGARASDLDRAERWARIAESALAPLLTNASPEILGFDDLAQLARTNRRVRSLDEPRAVPFRALTEKDSTRWLLLAMNGVLLRDAYSPETARLDGISFAEKEPLRGGAAWAITVAAARAFAGCGWACALNEPEYRTLSGMPVHLANDRGAPVSLSAESLMSPDVAAEAAAAGVTVLASARDRDAVVVPFAQMVFRGPVGREGVRGAAELTLADQLFVARVVPMVTEVAGIIPRDADPDAVIDTAQIALLSLFASEGARAPRVEAALRSNGTQLEVVFRPGGFRGVTLPEITLSAPLG